MAEAQHAEGVSVSWYDCNCDWITKYCDENHRRCATIPWDVLRQFWDAPERWDADAS